MASRAILSLKNSDSKPSTIFSGLSRALFLTTFLETDSCISATTVYKLQVYKLFFFSLVCFRNMLADLREGFS